MLKSFRAYAVALLATSLLVTSGCGFGAKVGNWPAPKKIEGVIAEVMEKRGVSCGCAIARGQLFFPATSAEGGAANKTIFKQYFASGICAPKGEIHFPRGLDGDRIDAEWETPRNKEFKLRSPTREDVFRPDFMGQDPSSDCHLITNPHDSNSYGYGN